MFALKNNLFTETGWDILETRFDPEQIVTTGSNFMLGNGYMGYRGTFAEWEADRYTACIVADTYDQAPDGRWRELCNVPNGLFTRLLVEGEPLSAFDGDSSDYQRRLDLRRGVFSRSVAWQGDAGKPVQLTVRKIASLDNVRLLAMRYAFRAEADAAITVETGIDGEVWSLNGDHFREVTPGTDGDLLAMTLVTQELGTQIAVVEGLAIHGAPPVESDIVQAGRRSLRRLSFDLAAGESVTLEKVVAIVHSNDDPAPNAAAVRLAQDALAAGYDALEAASADRWAEVWGAFDIQIDGDLEAQVLARFNLYQNFIATPTHARLPIGARGLSCQVYQGAAFWDQEIFNLPVFIYTLPEVARNILAYRWDTLDGARGKARRLGYYGAFYAWTSGKTGAELFPDFFFTDVLTGRPMHNHFNSWQIHISPDVVYALWAYYAATDDRAFIIEHGAEIAFEVAQFLVSRVHYKMDKRRYEFIRLLGPDEYHENVDNNAFTNYQAKFALERALILYHRMQQESPEALAALLYRLGLSAEDAANWADIAAHLYLPQPDADSGLIEQFDGYFALEDITPEALRERLIDPEEYWGWPNGIAVETQVNKQADVVQLLALHDLFPPDVVRANFDYYEPRTEHGSSLSPSVHALVAVQAGYTERAYDYFHESATIDLYNASRKVMSGGTFLGGIHTAAAGAAWSIIVQGFAGFRLDADGTAHFTHHLPQRWERLAFALRVRGQRLAITLTRDALAVATPEDNTAPVSVQVGAERQSLPPGMDVVFSVA